MVANPTAVSFVERLTALVPPAARAEFRRALRSGRRSAEKGFGVRMGSIFGLAKEFIELPPTEIDSCWTARSTRSASVPSA
jgi:hypothetical protein